MDFLMEKDFIVIIQNGVFNWELIIVLTVNYQNKDNLKILPLKNIQNEEVLQETASQPVQGLFTVDIYIKRNSINKGKEIYKVKF